IRRWPWYSLVVTATRRSSTSSTGSPGTSEAVWPSGPRPRWTRSRRSGSEVSYSCAAASRSRFVTGIGRSADWWSIERPRTMWVRLRSSEPGEAIRSSTWKSSVSAQGISSSSPRIASIAHGERPPLIAEENEPWSATARCPAAAISSAARLAAARSLSRTSRSIAIALVVPLFVATELVAHRRQDFVAEVAEVTRVEALVQRRGEDRGRHALLDRRDRGPAPLPRVGHAAAVLGQLRALGERRRGQVEQPGADHRAASPDLGDRRDVEVEFVELGLVERRRLGVVEPFGFARVGVLEDVQALRVGGHDPVLDPVVDHLHEVAGAARAAVEVAVLGRARGAGEPRRPLRQPAPRGGAGEDRVEPLDRPVGPADHQ